MSCIPSSLRFPAWPVAARAVRRPLPAILLALVLPAYSEDRGATAASTREVPQLVGEHFTLGCLSRVIIDDNDPKARQATARDAHFSMTHAPLTFSCPPTPAVISSR